MVVRQDNALLVVPAYNEQAVIGETLEGIGCLDGFDIVVIDDGSTDSTASIADSFNVFVVSHPINLGLGAALQTGLEYARIRGYESIVTFDADGQHDAKDIMEVFGGLEHSDMVIGVRCLNRGNMPVLKRVGNACLNLLTWVFFGVYSKDSQSGLRAFGPSAVKSMELSTNRYEVSSEILFEAKRRGLSICEVPIKAIYTKHSMACGTTVLDGFRILWRMLVHRGK